VVFRLDGEHRFTFASKAAERVLGVRAAWLTGRPLDCNPLPAAVCDAIAAAARGASGDGAGRADVAIGDRYFCVRVVRDRDRSAYLGVIEEVSTPSQHRDADSLERMLDIVGHDLRNPLSAILMTVQALVEAGAALPAIERIQRSALQMERMVEDLVDVTRVRRAGGLPVERRACDLGEIVADQIDEIRRIHPDREFRISQTVPGTGEFDPFRMTELLSNLLGNAARHGEHGPVDISVAGDGARVQLEVANRGVIPSSLLPTLFDPFTRAATSPRSQGLGLGLFICRAIVEAHGGTIAAHTGDGVTRLVVRLPRFPG
jgi:signal transduction histidine kinase